MLGVIRAEGDSIRKCKGRLHRSRYISPATTTPTTTICFERGDTGLVVRGDTLLDTLAGSELVRSCGQLRWDCRIIVRGDVRGIHDARGLGWRYINVTPSRVVGIHKVDSLRDSRDRVRVVEFDEDIGATCAVEGCDIIAADGVRWDNDFNLIRDDYRGSTDEDCT